MAACSFDMRFTFVYAGWEGIANDSRVLMTALTDPTQFKNKYNKLRQRYKNFKVMIHNSKFGWNPETNTVTASAMIWDDYLKANPDCKPFRAKGCVEYPKLCIIFGDTTATGRNAWSAAQDAIPVESHTEPDDSATQNNEVLVEEYTSTRRRKTTTGESIAESMRIIAEASREKYRRLETSSRGASFSISVCIVELKKYDLPPLILVKASKEL